MSDPQTAPCGIAPEFVSPIPAGNPAVEQCCFAWQAARDAVFQKRGVDDSDGYEDLDGSEILQRGRIHCEADRAAVKAYIRAMPTLASDESIQDFIACVTRGLLLEVFNDNRATRLLYAAQVASGALTRARKSRSRKSLAAKNSTT
jgi:hypothetical protein